MTEQWITQRSIGQDAHQGEECHAEHLSSPSDHDCHDLRYCLVVAQEMKQL